MTPNLLTETLDARWKQSNASEIHRKNCFCSRILYPTQFVNNLRQNKGGQTYEDSKNVSPMYYFLRKAPESTFQQKKEIN